MPNLWHRVCHDPGTMGYLGLLDTTEVMTVEAALAANLMPENQPCTPDGTAPTATPWAQTGAIPALVYRSHQGCAGQGLVTRWQQTRFCVRGSECTGVGCWR